MKLNVFLCASFLLTPNFAESAENFSALDAWKELDHNLQTHYAYLEDFKGYQQTRQLFENKLNNLDSKQAFIDLSQAYLRHFTDPHLNLGPLNDKDYSVYPTGADMYVEFNDNSALIIDVKRSSDANVKGLKPGDIVVKIDGNTIPQAIQDVMQVPLSQLNKAQKSYALNIALGGKRYQKREIEFQRDTKLTTVELAASYDAINALGNGPKVSYEKINEFGHIRFNNAMGNAQTVDEFKAALKFLGEVKGYIIDLRNTPSGGNTGVAEPILGHFTTAPSVYQKYRTQTESEQFNKAELKDALTKPAQQQIKVPFVVLAGRWTGSIGEGMTIGFDALGADAVIGAPMADLLGGIKRLVLDQSDAWVEVGFERLYHVNGGFREDFEPNIIVAGDMDNNGKDVALETAVSVLYSKTDKQVKK
ncbi:S41 family peptidase [Pseudoalteromonas piscicida]|uniref:S41 family peptidase n=1 Tax=Pseudoalteromonas piscicida TaxID=43662 RepID=UPI0005FA1BD3|nr:S41 family peptidase [Pseudoalteromonas piscicida]KJZ01031.1 carboxyl-terminal protease [Pseudoalteromonas piscicida]